MNEQIQNLKDKIWTEEYWTNPNTDKLLPAQLNRFAELIVEECAACCGSQADKKNIRRRFGLPVESNVQYSAPPVHGSITSQYTREYNIPK